MDFFKEQDKSRTKTALLIGLFILAVLAVVVAVYSIAVFILFSHGARQPGFNPAEFHWVQPHLGFWVISVTLLVIFIGSITKIIGLTKGGSSVAENLGGRLVNASTTDPDERKLINVVEEMSIASGIPGSGKVKIASSPRHSSVVIDSTPAFACWSSNVAGFTPYCSDTGTPAAAAIADFTAPWGLAQRRIQRSSKLSGFGDAVPSPGTISAPVPVRKHSSAL